MTGHSVSRMSVACLVCLAIGSAAGAQTVNDLDLPQESAEAPDPTPLAVFSARLAYNSDTGGVVGARVRTDRLFGDTQSLSFGFEVTDDSLSYSLLYGAPQIFGDSPAFGMRVRAAQTNADDVFDFDSRVFGIDPRLTWRLDNDARLAAYIGLSSGEISDVEDDTSILIRNDEGERMRQTIGLDYSQRRAGSGGNLLGWRYGLTLEAGQSDDDHSFTRLSGRLTADWSLGQNEGVRLRAVVRGGAITTLDGTSHIGDRTMLGGSSLRGFSFGGFGPRDLEVSGDPALGGNSFALARLDAQFTEALPTDRFVPGLFMDMGSLWGLDDTAGGVSGDDEVDDSARLRASLGVSVQLNTGLGPIVFSLAHPFERESYDEIEQLSVYFRYDL